MRIELSPQVADFLRSLAPEPRKQLRAALRDLAKDKGDILELEHPLDGFHRLRTGRYRVVFYYIIEKNKRGVRCVFAERRELVYELFSDLVIGE
ncbi:MAG: hypothetical protein KJ626_07665 [Verrucomicrobia bacterium]|nr:hypothetical protein [Verrucomicrobiota bacterium]